MNKVLNSSLAAMVAILIAVLPAFGQGPKQPTTGADKAKAKMETLMLKVEGVECANCAKVITETLHEAGLKVVGTVHPNTKGPSEVEVTCAQECDLGEAAAKINKAQTPHRAKVAPSLALRLFAKLDDESIKKCMAACEKMEGVDGKSCKCDAKTGEMDLKLTGNKIVILSHILTELKTATTGLECVVRLREFRPHVLVLEPALPWGGGAGVLEQMHRESDLPVVPVIVLTTGGDAKALDVMREFAVADVVRKPLDPYVLARRIRSVLDTWPAESCRWRNGQPATCWKEPASRLSDGNQPSEFRC